MPPMRRVGNLFAPEIERRAATPVTEEQMSEQERLDAQELEQEALAAARWRKTSLILISLKPLLRTT